MSFKALKNTLFCLISHCDHVSIETIMFVLSIDTCASIKGTQLPIVSRGSRVEWLFTPQPSGLLQKVSENKQLPSLSVKRETLLSGLGAEACKTQESGFCSAHGDGLKGQITSFLGSCVKDFFLTH